MNEMKSPPRAKNEEELWDMLDSYSQALAEARSKWPRPKGHGCNYPEQLVLNCLMTCRDQNFVTKEEYANLIGINLATLYRWNQKYQVFSLRGTKKRSKAALGKKIKKVDIQTLSAAPPEVMDDLSAQIEQEQRKIDSLESRLKLKRLQVKRANLEKELEDLSSSVANGSTYDLCPF